MAPGSCPRCSANERLKVRTRPRTLPLQPRGPPSPACRLGPRPQKPKVGTLPALGERWVVQMRPAPAPHGRGTAAAGGARGTFPMVWPHGSDSERPHGGRPASQRHSSADRWPDESPWTPSPPHDRPQSAPRTQGVQEWPPFGPQCCPPPQSPLGFLPAHPRFQPTRPSFSGTTRKWRFLSGTPLPACGPRADPRLSF